MTSHLTNMFANVSAGQQRQTHKGQAHWAGSGPEGKSCRECKFFLPQGRYASGSPSRAMGELKPGRCRKAAQLTGRQTAAFTYRAIACKYFEQNDKPPASVDTR
jgi:hypothetical protein